MTSEKITLYRVTEDKQSVVEQLPKTVSSQVYDTESNQFLDETLNDIRQALANVPEPVPVPSDQAIPAYWESHINTKIKTIRQIQDEDGVNRFTFGFITDMHLEGNNEKHSGNLMAKIDDEIHLPLVINGGDCVSHYQGAVSKANAIGQIREMFSMFPQRIREKMLYMVANHDDNSHSNQVWAETLKEGELYSQFFRYLDNKVVRGIYSPRYYYIDDTFHKTRFIVLDCNDVPYIQENGRAKYPISDFHVFRQNQLQWFADVALNVPDSSWAVLVTSHAPPYETGVTGFDRPVRNADMALGIIAAFRNKTTYSGTSLANVIADFRATVSADFRGKGGDVICWLAGDTHTDTITTMTPYANIVQVTTINDHKNRPSGEAQGTRGTITEQAFDIMTVDRASRRVYLTRIGAGSDREFSYYYSSGNPNNPSAEIFRDDFNRADANTLGSNWATYQGEFYIRDNTARSVRAVEIGSSNAVYSSSIVNVGTQNNISIEANLYTIDGEGFLFRHVNDENYFRLMIEYGKVELLMKENDVNTVIAQQDVEQGRNCTLKVELQGNSIRVFIDNVQVLTHESDKHLTATHCGIRTWSTGTTNGHFENFVVKQI